jgi:hypothetical protein
MACFSASHAPKSTSLQRSLQNGRQGLAALHSISRLQVGQAVRSGFTGNRSA